MSESKFEFNHDAPEIGEAFPGFNPNETERVLRDLLETEGKKSKIAEYIVQRVEAGDVAALVVFSTGLVHGIPAMLEAASKQ